MVFSLNLNLFLQLKSWYQSVLLDIPHQFTDKFFSGLQVWILSLYFLDFVDK